MRTTWTWSANDARMRAKKLRRKAERERTYRSGVIHGVETETRWRAYVMACAIADEMRAELEDRIARIFDNGPSDCVGIRDTFNG